MQLLMNTEENLPHLSTDLILEIFSRLSAKSIARCRCLSKLWASILSLGSLYFTELFLTQSITRPRLLFVLQSKDNKWYIYSSPQPQISYTNPKSSLSVTAEFHMSFPKTQTLRISPPISGLTYYPNMPDNNNGRQPVLCNPSTGQILWLPRIKPRNSSIITYFGYDPIDKQFKILSISYSLHSFRDSPSHYQILKLGDGRQSWRTLECPLRHIPSRCNVCINGVLYYLANLGLRFRNKIACFNLNSEEFKFIDEPWPNRPNLLVNLRGKFCGIYLNWVEIDTKFKLELDLWVLEDVEKEVWSEYWFILPSRLWNIEIEDNTDTHVSIGMTIRGDILLSLHYISNPFSIYFLNLEKNILQEIEVKGLEEFESSIAYIFADHVEDLRIF